MCLLSKARKLGYNHVKNVELSDDGRSADILTFIQEEKVSRRRSEKSGKKVSLM